MKFVSCDLAGGRGADKLEELEVGRAPLQIGAGVVAKIEE